MHPSGASSPTTGVPKPNPTDDPSAKDAVDNTNQQLLIDELQDIRNELSSMDGEDFKRMRDMPAVMTNQLPPVRSIEERDRAAKREKLEEREAQIQKELNNMRLEGLHLY